jgi:hypothetical protein
MSDVLGICCDGFIDRLNTLLVSTRISVGYALYLGSIAAFISVAKYLSRGRVFAAAVRNAMGIRNPRIPPRDEGKGL